MNKELKVFFLFTSIVIPLSLFWFLPVPYLALGTLTPTIAALVVARIFYGNNGVKELFVNIKQKIDRKWLMFSILLPIAIFILTLIFYEINKGFTVDILKLFPASAILNIPLMFLSFFLMTLFEEIGWRGFLIEKLTAKYSAFTSSLLVGILWAVWHLPLLLNPTQATSQFYLYICIMMATTILQSITFAYFYIKSKRSTVAVTVLHAGINITGALAGAIGFNVGDLFYYILFMSISLTALIILIVGRSELFKKSDSDNAINSH